MHDNLQRRNNAAQAQTQQTTGLMEDEIPHVGSLVWAAGKSRAQQAFNLYANIDYLRPYFDVEPKDIIHRLGNSFIPQWPILDQSFRPELYGPSMIVFTLSAILIYQMKISSHAIQDGTLIGTSFLVCFGYWLGSSFAISSLSFICNTHLTFIQILSINGYAMFSHCIVLLLATFIHTGYDHLFFYGLWFLLGGVAGLRMISIILGRTFHPRYRPWLGTFIVATHLIFLLYLHFAYHELAENVVHGTQKKDMTSIDSTTKLIASVIGSLTDSPLKARDRVLERNS